MVGAHNGDTHRVATVRDLDPTADQMFMDFITSLRKHHGNPRDGWYAINRAHGTGGRMSAEAFETVCMDMKFTKAFGRKMFNYLDLNADKNVSIEEWDFLSLWENRDPDEDPDCSMMSARLAGVSLRPNGASSPTGSVGDGRFSTSAPSSPVKKGAWSAAVASANEDKAGPGSAPAATVEFHVILTKDEHREYLRRRRELEMQASPAGGSVRFKPENRGSPTSSPTKTKGPLDPWIPM